MCKDLTPSVATIWELAHLYHSRLSSPVASAVEWQDGSQDSTAMPVSLSHRIAPAPGIRLNVDKKGNQQTCMIPMREHARIMTTSPHWRAHGAAPPRKVLCQTMESVQLHFVEGYIMARGLPEVDPLTCRISKALP